MGGGKSLWEGGEIGVGEFLNCMHPTGAVILLYTLETLNLLHFKSPPRRMSGDGARACTK